MIYPSATKGKPTVISSIVRQNRTVVRTRNILPFWEDRGVHRPSIHPQWIRVYTQECSTEFADRVVSEMSPKCSGKCGGSN